MNVRVNLYDTFFILESISELVSSLKPYNRLNALPDVPYVAVKILFKYKFI